MLKNDDQLANSYILYHPQAMCTLDKASFFATHIFQNTIGHISHRWKTYPDPGQVKVKPVREMQIFTLTSCEVHKFVR